ncbi:TPA: hypothetical protein SMP59_002200 [Proteus mirabilis]|uniref:hypothetical protein n=1 Tax=Proteus mirabilis TaxID=584 RepID=UPI000F5D0E56|nr:hypothetical protein [Proteus mirabilis]AZG97945.1 hypothetical protein EHQ66_04975 [Proteus mirabilis]MBG2992951.1 hypothetical protein [Proteus mirabilis]MCI9766866.1 hypothetical protein [Proteus mirabilis]MCI9770453.1 hypothetical protein [Proteus mirabilis]MCI9774047.1 hypothetical protein [Proteus mirabilis]
MPHHSHYILHDELIGFDIFKYIDIKFIFSNNRKRSVIYRLIFCRDENYHSLINKLYAENIKNLTISVVSFYNIETENYQNCDMFDKPPDSINLTSSETRYLDITLIDIILLIAQTEKIDILTFQAYSEELRRVYIRLINKYAESKNLNVYVEEAYFVIQTNI